MQISEFGVRSGVMVRCGLVLICLVALSLGVAGSEEAVQSCGNLVEPMDRESISSPAEVPAVYLARLNEGDAERVTHLFATDAVHRGPDGKIRRGRAAIREFYEVILGSAPRKFAVSRIVANGDRVAFELIDLQQPCNDDDPALVVDLMDINQDGQIQLFTVFTRPQPR